MVLATAATASAAAAACKPLPTEAPKDYLAALSKHLAPMGVAGIIGIGATPSGADHYIMPPSVVSLFLTVEAGRIVEIGAVASAPLEEGDGERQLDLVAFTLARYSVNPEKLVLDKIEADAAAHLTPGVWVERFGQATAVFTRTPDALIVKFGKADCN